MLVFVVAENTLAGIISDQHNRQLIEYIFLASFLVSVFPPLRMPFCLSARHIQPPLFLLTDKP